MGDRTEGEGVVARVERHDAEIEFHAEVHILKPGIDDAAFDDHFAGQFDIAEQEGLEIGRAFTGAAARALAIAESSAITEDARAIGFVR